MAKFDYRIVEKRNAWAAEITRQVTSRRTVVSKRQLGFESEAEAVEWAQKELVEFAKTQAVRNDRKSEQRTEKEEMIARKKEKSAAQKAEYEAARGAANDEDEYDYDEE